jgi:hypothetical protein
MRSEIDWVIAVRIGRIQDKTRWTKALGEAVTLVYGDCMGGDWPEQTYQHDRS